MDDYIPSLKKSIKTGKIGQTKSILSKLASQPEPLKLEVLEVLALAPDKAAFELLSFLTSDKQKDPDIHDRLIQLITDRAHLNFKFVLILLENTDKEIVHQSIPLVRHILSNETDKDFLKTIIKTIGKLQIEELVKDLAEFIFYDDAKLKAESIQALERVGSDQACKKLIQASKTEKCDQDILDAIDVLSARRAAQAISEVTQTIAEPEPQEKEPEETSGYDDQLEKLASEDIHERFEAFTSFSQEGDKIAAELSGLLECGNHDLSINMLRLIERTIPLSATNDLFDIINEKKVDSTIKFAAYSALNAFPKLKSAAAVVKGLSEPALYVRLAAIQVLDKNLSDFVCAEIKNKIESGTKKGEALAEDILDARAANIIESLMISDTFSYMASNYLARTAPLPVLDTFISILEKRKLKSTARKYHDLRKEKTGRQTKELVVISSSETILNTYNKLICACGFSAQTFQNPQDAFEAIVYEKPTAVICDLFINDLTGMEIAKEIRELYPKDDVPVIISTLQKNLDKTKLDAEIEKSGANTICEFPAKTSQIKSWVK